MWEGEQCLYFASITDFPFLFLSILFPNFPDKGLHLLQEPFCTFIYDADMGWVADWGT